MKRVTEKAAAAAMILLACGALANAADCRQSYMHDPCAHDGYSIVETEPFVKGHHNWMEVVHHYPWELRQSHHHHGYRGKNTVRAQSPVVGVDY